MKISYLCSNHPSNLNQTLKPFKGLNVRKKGIFLSLKLNQL